MKRTTFVLCCFLFLCALYTTAVLAQITPKQDAYTNSADPTTNYGTASTLGFVSSSTSIQTTFLQFDLSSIPSGYTGTNVAKATLKLYVNSVTTAGSFNIDLVTGTWAEKTITYSLSPTLGSTIASSMPLTTSNVHDYVLIDVTTAVNDWLNGTPNDGLALVANSPLNATIDSKENTTQSHPSEIDIVFAGGGTITGVTTASGSGLTGGVNSGVANLSLLKTCAANQVLQFVSGAWTCANVGTGTVTNVATGTGLTGGPITSSGTLGVAVPLSLSGSTNASGAIISATNTGGGAGISGTSKSGGAGLFGQSYYVGGVVGWNNGPSGLNPGSAAGVVGDSNSGRGVWGSSSVSDGVRGDSSSASAAGVAGFNPNGVGVIGQSGNSNPASVGVEGILGGSSGFDPAPFAALFGDTNSTQGVGLEAISSGGPTGVGLVAFGRNGADAIDAFSDFGYGVLGATDSSSGAYYGVYGVSGERTVVTTNYGRDGVHGESVDSNSAGVGGFNFSGGVGVYGNVSGTCSQPLLCRSVSRQRRCNRQSLKERWLVQD